MAATVLSYSSSWVLVVGGRQNYWGRRDTLISSGDGTKQEKAHELRNLSIALLGADSDQSSASANSQRAFYIGSFCVAKKILLVVRLANLFNLYSFAFSVATAKKL